MATVRFAAKAGFLSPIIRKGTANHLTSHDGDLISPRQT